MQFFAKSQKFDLLDVEKYKYDSGLIFSSYGILRGNGEIIKKSKDYIYLDHGFFNSSKRRFAENMQTKVNSLNGYFRVIKNDLYFNQNFNEIDKNRFLKLNITLEKPVKNGEYIILSEPSLNTLEFNKISEWTNNTCEELKKFTDRKIIIHNKFSKVPLTALLNRAYAFVSYQSTAGFLSIIKGVPSFFTHESLKKHGNIKDIENVSLNYNLLYLAANSQWKLSEFFSNEFNEYLANLLDT